MAAEPQSAIPIVDFSVFGVHKDNIDDTSEEAHNLGAEILRAFSSVGFVYLRNHGIPESKVEDVQKVSETFFELPKEKKQNYSRLSDGSNHGWIALERERLNPARAAADLKEAFNVPVLNNTKVKWPNDEAPGFESKVGELYNQCIKLTFRVLHAVSLGMDLKDKNWLLDCHKGIGKHGNATTMRILYYPPITNNNLVKPGQVRCGEHSDYGTITLLFQDEFGGLEVLPLNSDYIPAPYIPGCVLVNIGDLMMRWTADKLISTTLEDANISQDDKDIGCDDTHRHRKRQVAFVIDGSYVRIPGQR
ncbi:2-oxoglutarate-Fe(II) type oxidoreductase ppzD isoform X2 [Nematostella vectensis]|uniref:2-oxoglutarate-Fe(II) type oxidoreductase ppzD isoform X2 n=1 Tax=Nematostella vectensis TaxID=45351 RepID=UPI0020776C3B|nr:2-oxoglutarate-Fe(II) type oxidoreductase ppzD isoform X2 [Nematostella vectensis]